MGPNAGGSLNLSSCIVGVEDTLCISSMGILQYCIEEWVRRIIYHWNQWCPRWNSNMKNFKDKSNRLCPLSILPTSHLLATHGVYIHI